MSDLQPTFQQTIGSPEDESREGLDLDGQNFVRIISTYLKQIELPKEKPIAKFFLCPIGLVGSGKSTVIKPLSEHFGLARVSGDEIRKLLKENGFNLIRTVEIAFHVVARLVKEGYSIALDSDCSGPNVQETIERAAKENAYQVFYLHINPPEEFILNKLKNFQHTWLFKDADHAIRTYYHRKPLHENIKRDFLYTFDTSKPDLTDQIQEAISLIEKKLN